MPSLETEAQIGAKRSVGRVLASELRSEAKQLATSWRLWIGMPSIEGVSANQQAARQIGLIALQL